MNCFRGFAPTMWPTLRFPTVSLQLHAAPAVTPAVIRFAVMLPGADAAPKVSWVTLPIGPMGFMPISAPARAVTAARKNVSTTATAPIHHVNRENPLQQHGGENAGHERSRRRTNSWEFRCDPAGPWRRCVCRRSW